MVADEQRPEADPGALRVGEPAEDELLPAEALYLHPRRVASADVVAGEELADDALVAPATGITEEGLTLPLPELRPQDPVGPLNGFAEEPFPLGERLSGQVPAVKPEQVEEEERGPEALGAVADLVQ